MPRPQIAAPVEEEARRSASGVHSLRQRVALLRGAVCQDDIGKGKLVDGVGMRVVVEVVGRPSDGEDIGLAAGVGLAVESNGGVEVALGDEAPLGVSVGVGWVKRDTYSADKVKDDLDLDDRHGQQMFGTRG